MQQSSALSTKCTASPLFAFHLLSSIKRRRWNPVRVEKKTYGNEILYIVVNWLKIKFQTSKLEWGEVRLGSTVLASFFFFFKAHLIEMLCFTLTALLFDNASMHSGYKSTLFFWYSKPHKDTVRWIYLASFISGVDAELWHFTCTSKSGFAIQLSDICKGHNLYLFVWFLGCQCLCVEHNFFFFLRGRCQRFESCWVHSAPPINWQALVMSFHRDSFFDLIA